MPACALAYSGRMESSPDAAPVPPPGVGTPPGGGIPATLVKSLKLIVGRSLSSYVKFCKTRDVRGSQLGLEANGTKNHRIKSCKLTAKSIVALQNQISLWARTRAPSSGMGAYRKFNAKLVLNSTQIPAIRLRPITR